MAGFTQLRERQEMEKETIIILCILVAMVVAPIAFLKFWHRPSRLTLVGDNETTSHNQRPDLEVTKGKILDEMCKMQSGVMVTRLAQGKGLSEAEINILKYKANPFHSGAFRVAETANEDEINKWLKHPMVNHPWSGSFVMDMAAQTPIPVKMMERILRKLLQDNYDSYWKKAEEKVRSINATV